jgi:hypothetical protein
MSECASLVFHSLALSFMGGCLLEVFMAAKLYKATATFPSLGEDSRQEVIVEAGGWAAAMGLAARRLKALAPLKRKQIKICSIELQLMDGGAPQSIEAAESSTGAAEEQAE